MGKLRGSDCAPVGRPKTGGFPRTLCPQTSATSPFPWLHALPVLAALLAAAPAAAQEQQVRDAIAARFPGGIRRCLILSPAMTGIHVPSPQGGVLWYLSDGPTSPDRHLFVLYAAPADDPVPDLVANLADAGVVHRVVVTATTDTQRQRLGAQTQDRNGISYHPTLFSHERGTFPVAIYETAPNNPAFRYQTIGSLAYGPRFPSRLYNTPLPPSDQSYTVPVTEPYAMSLVDAACLAETVDTVANVEQKTLWTGAPYVQAVVSFREEAPDWMRTPVFTRTVMTPDSPSVTAFRHATVLFSIRDGKLVYEEEERRP